MISLFPLIALDFLSKQNKSLAPRSDSHDTKKQEDVVATHVRALCTASCCATTVKK